MIMRNKSLMGFALRTEVLLLLCSNSCTTKLLKDTSDKKDPHVDDFLI